MSVKNLLFLLLLLMVGSSIGRLINESDDSENTTQTSADTHVSNFQSVPDTGIVVVQFSATWCGWCTKQLPHLKESSKTHKNIQYFINEDEDVNRHFGVSGLPTTVLFKDGKEIDRNEGYMNTQEINHFVNRTKVSQ